jgi:tripartite-type tricarboxylate transporter receptor subunit TctC
MSVDAATSAPDAREGREPAIGATGSGRLLLLRETPAVMERGFPRCGTPSRNAVHAPAGTPAPIVPRMGRPTEDVMARPAARARRTADGMALRPGSPEDLAASQAAGIDSRRRLVAAAEMERR